MSGIDFYDYHRKKEKVGIWQMGYAHLPVLM
jgi:hypothetical protein